MALDDVKQSIISNITNAYDKALDKGATEPENKNLENLATTIDSIQGGTTLGYNVRSVINEDGETQTLKIISGENILLQDKTATPIEEEQRITADEGYFAIENMIVGAIPSNYIGSAVPKVEATTYTPTTTDIVIDANQYLNGAQIIEGDANLLPENIAKDVELFGLVGTHEGGIQPSGTIQLTENNKTYDVTNYANAEVNVPTDGGEGGLGQALNYGVSEIYDYNGEVTDLREYAFYSNSILTDVSFPQCEVLGSYAFVNCKNLKSVSFPNCKIVHFSAFYSCASLTNIDLPNCEKFTGYGVFGGNTRVTSINLPKCSDVAYAFMSNRNMSYINLPIITSLSQSAFYGADGLVSISLPECSYIGNGAFMGCTNLSDIHLPKLTSLATSVFARCSKLSYFNLDSLTSIPDSTFNNCAALTSVIAENITHVGAYAFSYCPSLPSISLPKCTHIGSQAFAQCFSLSSVYCPELSSIGKQAFYYCRGLIDVDIPKVSIIEQSAFMGCSVLQSVNAPQCTAVYPNAFSACSSLTHINIPLCTTLSTQAFQGCSALKSINLPNCLSLNYSAFTSCSNLSIVVLGSSCKLTTSNVFANTPMSNSTYLGYFGSVYVPADYVDYYKASSVWSYYADRITSIENLPTT